MTLRSTPRSTADGAWVLGAVGGGLVAAVCASDPAWWSGFVAASLASSAALVALWRRDPLSTREVLVGAVLLRLAFVPLLPGLSDDVYRYVWDGWLQWEGINPYRYRPDAEALSAFHDTEVYDRLNSREYFSVYPPISQLVFALGGAARETDWPLSYFVIKGVFLLFELAGLYLLSRMASARNLLLYAWNPLVLVEAAGQGHTEAAVVPFLVGVVWAVQADRGRLASLAVAGAGLVKLYPFVLGPYLLRRFGWRAVWPGTVLVALASAPYAAPYVLPHLKASVDLYVQLFEFNAGVYYGVKELFALVTGADWSKEIGPAFRLLFLAALPVLYVADARYDWRFRRAVLTTLGLFFVLSTTVHPWYLLAVLPLAVLGRTPASALSSPSWAWVWLSACSLGTYLFYIGGPYWPWVIAGWSGFVGLAAVQWVRRRGWASQWLQAVQQRRAAGKADRVLNLLAADDTAPPLLRASSHSTSHSGRPLQVLDLGAGEGYVGAALARQLDADVELVDVVDMNRTALPHRVYDGRSLPESDDGYDLCVVYFVLHHTRDPRAVLSEALRVTRPEGRVVVAESVYTNAWQHAILRRLDPIANSLRSGGVMDAQEEHLSFRTAGEWAELAENLGACITHVVQADHPIHPQAFYVLAPPSSESGETSSDVRASAEEVTAVESGS